MNSKQASKKYKSFIGKGLNPCSDTWYGLFIIPYLLICCVDIHSVLIYFLNLLYMLYYKMRPNKCGRVNQNTKRRVKTNRRINKTNRRINKTNRRVNKTNRRVKNTKRRVNKYNHKIRGGDNNVMIDARYMLPVLNYHGITMEQFRTIIITLEKQCTGLDEDATVNAIYGMCQSLNIKHLPGKRTITRLVNLINKVRPSNRQTFVNRLFFMTKKYGQKYIRGGSGARKISVGQKNADEDDDFVTLDESFDRFMIKMGLYSSDGKWRPGAGKDWGLHRYDRDGGIEGLRANLLFLLLDIAVGGIFSIILCILYITTRMVYRFGWGVAICIKVVFELIFKLLLLLGRGTAKLLSGVGQGERTSSKLYPVGPVVLDGNGVEIAVAQPSQKGVLPATVAFAVESGEFMPIVVASPVSPPRAEERPPARLPPLNAPAYVPPGLGLHAFEETQRTLAEERAAASQAVVQQLGLNLDASMAKAPPSTESIDDMSAAELMATMDDADSHGETASPSEIVLQGP
jgi:hypothetical protein